jgi:hypothetical protein
MVKQKVKLVFAKNFVEIPTSRDHFSTEIEITVPDSIDSEVHLVAARTYSNHESNDEPIGDYNATIWNYSDESRLVGKLLTYIDATYTDKEQREAHKNIVKDLVYAYCQDLRTRGIQTVNAAK